MLDLDGFGNIRALLRELYAPAVLTKRLTTADIEAAIGTIDFWLLAGEYPNVLGFKNAVMDAMTAALSDLIARQEDRTAPDRTALLRHFSRIEYA